MPDTITQVQIKAYTDLVLMRAQQMESKARKWAQVKDGVRGESVSFDRIGMIEMTAKPSRQAPTPNNDPNHERRWATMAAYNANIFIDTTDIVTVLQDPTSDYVRAHAAAIGRQWDRFILTAALATVSTGPTGAGSETWPVTDRKAVSHQIAAGGTGFTLAKLKDAKRMLDSLMVGTERVVFWDAWAQEQFLANPEVTSADYNTTRVLVDGAVKSFLGFAFEMVDSALMTTSGTTYSAVIMERGAVGLGISIDKTVKIDQRPDLSYAWQVYAEMMGGAARRDGERIVEVLYVAA